MNYELRHFIPGGNSKGIGGVSFGSSSTFSRALNQDEHGGAHEFSLEDWLGCTLWKASLSGSRIVVGNTQQTN